jgi:hypothetical protein
MPEQQQVLLVAVIVGLAAIVFGLDWADRRRNQRTLQLLTDFVSNPEVRRAIGVSDTPAGLTFVAPDPHVWLPYFVGREEMEAGADWPFYVVEKWERNEIGETRYVESRLFVPEREYEVLKHLGEGEGNAG